VQRGSRRQEAARLVVCAQNGRGTAPTLLRLMILATRQIVGDIDYDLIKIALDGKKLSFCAIQTLRTHRIQSLLTACAYSCPLPLTE
jgi:hypothetical protein